MCEALSRVQRERERACLWNCFLLYSDDLVLVAEAKELLLEKLEQ